MVAILTKSDASEGFDQILEFLNGSYIQYALTMNPHIYVSCIKQFWKTVTVKQSADVTRLQALVDKKKVLISKAVIRDVLRLDDAEGVNCLPNEEIFTGLARMGYEKPSTKLTFYKAFFLSQWKFLIHTIMQSLSAKRTSWNEFSSTMESAVICLCTCRKFNFSKVGKGFLRVETPLFEGMLVVQENVVEGIADEQVQDDVAITTALEDVTAAVEEDIQAQLIPSPAPPTSPPPQDIPSTSHITKLKTRVKKLERANKVKPLKLRRLREDDNELDRDEGIELMGKKEEKKKDIADDDQAERRHAEIQAEKQAEKQAEIYQIDMDHAAKVLSMHEEESTEVQEVVEVLTTAKLITEVVTAASAPVSAASTIILAAEPNIPAVTITAAPVKDAAASTRQRRGVVIRDPKEESTAITHVETKEKGKGIMVEEPKPMKKKQHVEMDEAYARKLHEELNHYIDWDVAINHVKQKAKEDPFIQKYQVMKKRPQTKAQTRRNMITYLKNTAGFRLDYFKGMSYEEEANRALESINETPAQKVAKKRRLNKEDKDVEEIKQHLEIVPDEDDDVYTEATPLARKSQRSVHGQAMVKSWKLLTSCGVHIISFTTTQLILLVKRRYILSKFTLEQMLDVVRLQVEGQSEMSLELIRSLKKNTKCVNAADAAKLKLKLLMKSAAAAGSSEEITKHVVPTGRVVVPTGRYVVSAGNVIIVSTSSLKRTRRDRDGRVIILPPMTTEEHIAVQRESKSRTTMLQ
nr:hypothetical protein [Tanacetum cinerariifolium]